VHALNHQPLLTLFCPSSHASACSAHARASLQFDELYEAFKTATVPGWLTQLSDYLGANDWFAGTLTIADFVLYEGLDVVNSIVPGAVDAVANLKAFMERFRALKGVREYVLSDAHKQLKFNNKMAMWGG
jgi:glutathione S-transferase